MYKFTKTILCEDNFCKGVYAKEKRGNKEPGNGSWTSRMSLHSSNRLQGQVVPLLSGGQNARQSCTILCSEWSLHFTHTKKKLTQRAGTSPEGEALFFPFWTGFPAQATLEERSVHPCILLTPSFVWLLILCPFWEKESFVLFFLSFFKAASFTASLLW